MANALSLIRSAYGLASLIGFEDEMEAPRANYGLEILNDILNIYGQKTNICAYNTTKEFITTPGQDTYIFTKNQNEPGGVIIDSRKIAKANYVTCQYPDNLVVYPVKIILRSDYFYQLRFKPQSTRPFYAYFQNFQSTNDGSEGTKLIFYPIPDISYTIQVVYKQTMVNLNLNEGLDEVPRHLFMWLKYMIAHQLCQTYDDSRWTTDKQLTLDELKIQINALSDVDMTISNVPDGYVADWERIGSGIL